jgi:hypothetical protein
VNAIWRLTLVAVAGLVITAARVAASEAKTVPDRSVAPPRLVLEGVPRVGCWPSQNTSAPQDDLLPGALQAYLRFVEDTTDYDRLSEEPGDKWHHVHEYLMGTSGHAFRLLWTDDWNFGGNPSFLAIAPNPLAPVRRAFDSIGYSCEVLLRADFARSWKAQGPISDDEAVYRGKIIESLGKGRPVIGIGVAGPPEPCLLTGYDEGGAVLLGWSGWQDDAEFRADVETDAATGYFRKRNWFRDTRGIIVVGERAPRRPQLDIYRDTLTWGLGLMRAKEVQGRHAGQAAYQAWIDGLLQDDVFKGLDEKALKARYDMHWLSAGSLAEARAWGAPFLREIIPLVPEAKADLEAAASCFDAEHDLVWATWEFTTPREGQTSLQRFADPGVRRRMVPLIRLMKEKDAEAAGHIERALAKMGRG